MSNCPKTPTLSDADKAAGLAECLKQLGLTSCSQTTGGAGGISIFPPGFIGGGVATSTGCEQVSVIGDSIAAMQNNVKCILNEVRAELSIAVNQSNTAEIHLTGFKGRVDLVQRNYAGVVAVSKLSQTQKDQITDRLSSDMNTLLDNMAKSKTEFLGSPQGQKVVQNLQKQLTQNEITKQANKAVNEFDTTMDQTNRLVITVDGYDPFSARGETPGEIHLTQENVFQYQAAVITSNFLSNIFDTTEGAAFKEQIKNSLESEAAGPGSLIGGLAAGFLLVVVLVLVMSGGGAVRSVLKYLVPLLILAAIAAAVVFGVKKQPAPAAIAGGSAAILGVMEFFILKS